MSACISYAPLRGRAPARLMQDAKHEPCQVAEASAFQEFRREPPARGSAAHISAALEVGKKHQGAAASKRRPDGGGAASSLSGDPAADRVADPPPAGPPQAEGAAGPARRPDDIAAVAGAVEDDARHLDRVEIGPEAAQGGDVLLAVDDHRPRRVQAAILGC